LETTYVPTGELSSKKTEETKSYIYKNESSSAQTKELWLSIHSRTLELLEVLPVYWQTSSDLSQ
jgi:hypothetical protein